MSSPSRALLASAVVAAIASLAGAARAGCPFSGVAAYGFGTGAGDCSSATLTAEFDATSCSLRLFLAQDPFWCGNTYLTQHLLILGASGIPNGIPAGAPLIPGSSLYVDPLLVLGPFPGGLDDLALPDDASLIGLTFFAQTAPSWITTVSFPLIPVTGLSSGLQITLQ